VAAVSTILGGFSGFFFEMPGEYFAGAGGYAVFTGESF
jgi:hypothetical protein